MMELQSYEMEMEMKNVSKKGKARLNKVMDARDLCLLVSAIIP